MIMKFIHLFIIILGISVICPAQEITDNGKQNIAGKWKGTCAMTYKNRATILTCPICPFIINENDRHLATIGDIEMTFTQDSIYIITGKDNGIVLYKMDPDSHAIKFSYGKADYDFRVFYLLGNVILEDNEGLLLNLERQP